MAEVRGFRGVRYVKAKVGEMDAVVSPPYDVISPDERRWYCERHPNNIVRLILPEENGDKYQNAAKCLDEWLKAGVLARDPEPSIYAIEEAFEIEGHLKKRFGFVCLMRLEDFGTGVLPHENVLAKPLEDRLNLTRATRANFDSIFCLDADGRATELIRPSTSGGPDASATDKAGVRTDLWRISDPETIRKVSDLLAGGPVVIADGHHRYSAALAYRNEMRAANGSGPDAPHEFIMVTLVSLDDEGLVILPTHRLVRNIEGFDPDAFRSRLGEFFEIEEAEPENLMQYVELLGSHTFGVHLGGRSCVIRLKPDIALEQSALKQLDVTILHSLILEKILGIGAEALAAQANLTYMRDADKAVQSVDSGEYQIALLMNPPEVEEVKAVAAAGGKMPQKSTFFYPKLLTGMVLRVME